MSNARREKLVRLESAQIQTDPSCIDFGIGQPQLEILPRDLLWRTSQALLSRYPYSYLNYGHGKGDGLFRVALAEFLSASYGRDQDPNSIFCTGGASLALHLIASTVARPNDVVLVEEPTYFLVPQIFRDCGLKLVGVPIEEDGVNLELLEAAIKKYQPKFFYTIPVFQNPTGHSTSEEKKQKVLELAERHDLLIVADEVYQLLHYSGRPPEPYANSLLSDRVISVGSFSKILAPGLRLGWLQTAPRWMRKFEGLGLLKSGGGLNHYVGSLVGEALADGSHRLYTEKLRQEYAFRVECMDSGLRAKLGSTIRYRKPGGGYFFWLELTPGLDAEELEKTAKEHGTGFRSGRKFSNHDGFKSFLRLSFAHYNENAISVGIDRLARAIREHSERFKK